MKPRFALISAMLCGALAAAGPRAPAQDAPAPDAPAPDAPKPAPPAPKAQLAVKAGKVYTGTGDVVAGAVILVRDGRIAAVGPDVQIPKGTPTVSAAVVVPGLIDAYTHTMIGADDAEPAVAPDIRAADGVDLYARHDRALAGGVTALYVAPGERRLVAGLGAVVKTAGPPERRLVLHGGALELRLGESPKRPPSVFDPPLPPSADTPIPPATPQLPSTRMGEMSVLRWLFDGAPPAALSEGARDVVEAVKRGEIPVRVLARSAADGRRALAFGKAHGWKLILVDLPDALRLAPAIAEQKAAVVLTGWIPPGDAPPDEPAAGLDTAAKIAPDTAAKLHAHGVALAIHSAIPGRWSSTDVRPDLLLLAGYAVRHGLPPAAGLRAITLGAAEICGVAERTGSIAAGKDADLCVLSGDPFAAGTHVLATVVEGQVAWRRRPRKSHAPEAEGPVTVIKAGRFLTVTGGTVTGGVLLSVDGTIRGLGPDVQVPKGAKVLDFKDAVVVPGFIDARSALGLRGPGGSRARGGTPAGLGAVAQIPPEDAATAVAAGVTTVVLMPEGGSSGVIGTAAVVKLAGDDPVVRDDAAVVLGVSGAPSSAKSAAEGLLKSAQSYDRSWTAWEAFLAKYGGKEPPPPPPPRPGQPPRPTAPRPRKPRPNPVMDVFRAALRGEARVIVQVNSAGAAKALLEVFGEATPPLVPALMGSSALVAGIDALAGGGHRGAIVVPPLRRRLPGGEVNVPAVLAEAGIPVAFASHAAKGSRHLPYLVTHAMRDGLPARDALRAVTLVPARMLGVDDRLGSLEHGKDCDCVVLTGNPFDPATRVRAVIVGGTVVFDAKSGK